MEKSLVRFPMNVQRPSNSERKDGRMYTNLPVSLSSRKCCTNSSQARNRHSKQSSKRHVDLVTSHKTKPNCAHFRCTKSEKSLETHLDGYAQVSSQFVLIPDSAYLKTNYDGIPPQWDQILFVKVLNKGDLVCPICLYPPITPRMGRCGHIYCWPCALQYLKYENESDSKKCSVCPSLLSFNELKRVSLTHITPTKVGDSICLTLVKRSGLCVTPLSLQTHEPTSETFFGSVCVTDPIIMKNIHESEIDQLRTYRAICEVDGNNTELIPFIDFAFEELKREEVLQKFCSTSSTKPCKSCSQDLNGISSNETYFYQAVNSQPIFLDSLGWRCLLTEYKETQNLPKEIFATVASTKNYRMNSSLRKPLKYLSHLPDGYAFSLVEIKLEPPLVSELTLSHFATSLNNRALERDRSRLEDLKLTELKEAAENQFASLPPGFVLSGHATLSDKQEVQLDPSNFVPLSTATQTTRLKKTLPISFAEVSRSGALNVVGPDRVAHFSRSPPKPTNPKRFDINSESWPTLSKTSKS
ncbi:unnamed protein product [Schistosoma rodhaini]|uniref:E3 ubiquitin-protein ligase RNF10 n=1 Tax=Schistosoma rodhaini TaxID=6188 RepID=A0AA85G4H3_9TREM|nr:unnamed protein product [Schistosoma rodhaini]CAH8608477.1 unnamed protein product [Schistosoma rodhaini]